MVIKKVRQAVAVASIAMASLPHLLLVSFTTPLSVNGNLRVNVAQKKWVKVKAAALYFIWLSLCVSNLTVAFGNDLLKWSGVCVCVWVAWLPYSSSSTLWSCCSPRVAPAVQCRFLLSSSTAAITQGHKIKSTSCNGLIFGTMAKGIFLIIMQLTKKF